MPDDSDLSDVLIPNYKFEWDDPNIDSRTTDEVPPDRDFINLLVEQGHRDEECTVTKVGYST